MKTKILQILHKESTTNYYPYGENERVLSSDYFDTVTNQIINIIDQQNKEKDLHIIDLEDKLKMINDSYLLDSIHGLNRNKELREEIERKDEYIKDFLIKDNIYLKDAMEEIERLKDTIRYYIELELSRNL